MLQKAPSHMYDSKYPSALISDVKTLHPDPEQREKIYLNFYFHFSLWCLKRFYEGI